MFPTANRPKGFPPHIECPHPKENLSAMSNIFRKLRASEHGAVTVDWVVLTAGMIGLCIAAYTTMGDQTRALSTTVGDELTDQASAF
jgi:Flp pilus assembly pilin Flp